MSSDLKLYARAAGLGVIAGLRSMTAPALISRFSAEKGLFAKNASQQPAWGTHPAALLLGALAVGEMVFDKLPIAPKRTLPGSLFFRAASGALVGATLFAAKREDRMRGAVAGAIGAVAATYGAYHLRKALGEHWHVPDPVLGLVEDAIAVGTGISVLQSS